MVGARVSAATNGGESREPAILFLLQCTVHVCGEGQGSAGDPSGLTCSSASPCALVAGCILVRQLVIVSVKSCLCIHD